MQETEIKLKIYCWEKMVDFGTVFVTVGVLALIEGIIVLLWPNWAKKIVTSLMETPRLMRKLGMTEIVIAIVLLILGVVMR